MQYLVDRYDKDHKVSYPAGTKEYWEVNNWVCGIEDRVFSLCDTNVLVDLYSSCGRWPVLVPCKGKLCHVCA